MIDLDEIEERVKAASDGPWTLREERGWHIVGPIYDPADPDELPAYVASDVCLPDATFIYNARADVPALIARVRELEGRLKRLEWDATRYCSFCHAFQTGQHKDTCPVFTPEGKLK